MLTHTGHVSVSYLIISKSEGVFPMLRHATSFGHRNFTIAMAQVIVLGLIALPLAGCGADGQGGPVISSLSTPEETPSSEVAKLDSNSTAVGSTGEEDPTISTTTETTAIETNDSDVVTNPPGDDPQLDPVADQDVDSMVAVTATPTGATARLTWAASADPNVEGYFIHYGKQSSGEPGSCSYEESQRVGTPPATITGLEPNTVYFFAISAFGESESESDSLCSNEVLVTTPSVQG